MVDLIRTAIVDRPLEHIQMPSPCCIRSGCLIPGAALAPEPLQYLQVTTVSCIIARCFIPRAALAPEPLRCLQVTIFAGIRKDTLVQPVPLLGFQPLQGLQLASLRCEEERERETSQTSKQRRGDCGRRRTCSPSDLLIMIVDGPPMTQELLQQRQVAMKRCQAPDILGLLRNHFTRYFLFAAEPEVVS